MADIKTSEYEVREYAESIINTVRDPLIVLDHDLRVISDSPSFYDAFNRLLKNSFLLALTA